MRLPENPSLPLTLQWYLMASYLYYEHDISVIPDGVFDKWCVELYLGWDTFDHPHKHLVDPELLKAGSGYGIRYPLLAKHAAHLLTEDPK